jgi:ribosomal protein S18 acetylase RimI-like enzyme
VRGMTAQVQPLGTEHAAQYRALMLHGYQHEPDAFTAMPEERAGLPLAWWEQRIADARQDRLAFGALAEGKLVGAVALEFSPRPKTSHKAFLIGMYVLEAWRGQGLGRKLVDAALGHACRRAGTEVVTLTVTEGNAAAIALYQAAGFRSFGVEPMAMRTPSGFKAKVHMWRQLASRPFNFYAAEVSSEPVDGIWTVAFAAPGHGDYFLLQRDVENVLGKRQLNTHYIEFGDQSRGCHGGIEKVQVLPDAIRFQLTAAGAERIGVPEIVVSFSLSKVALAAMSAALAHIVEHGRVEILCS